jgi:hypothetical protein
MILIPVATPNNGVVLRTWEIIRISFLFLSFIPKGFCRRTGPNIEIVEARGTCIILSNVTGMFRENGGEWRSRFIYTRWLGGCVMLTNRRDQSKAQLHTLAHTALNLSASYRGKSPTYATLGMDAPLRCAMVADGLLMVDGSKVGSLRYGRLFTVASHGKGGGCAASRNAGLGEEAFQESMIDM